MTANTADIDSIEDIDLDTEVVYFEGQRLAEAQAPGHRSRHRRPPRTQGRTSTACRRHRPDRAKAAPRTPSALTAPRTPRSAPPSRSGRSVSESELAREAIDDYLTRAPQPTLRDVPYRQCALCISIGVRWHGDITDAGVGLRRPDRGCVRGERDGSPHLDHVVRQVESRRRNSASSP